MLLLFDGLNSTRRARSAPGEGSKRRFRLRSIFSPVFVRIASALSCYSNCFARFPLCCTGAAVLKRRRSWREHPLRRYRSEARKQGRRVFLHPTTVSSGTTSPIRIIQDDER